MKRALILCLLMVMAACAPVPPPAPPPPPPPGPVAAPPPGGRAFTVYFAWNRSWVGPDGMAILRVAADASKAGGPVNVQITGYTDTTGTPHYNQRLSLRRAYHVADVLSRMGVPRNTMTVAGRGIDDLAVPTPPGVREEHNRRVTIVE